MRSSLSSLNMAVVLAAASAAGGCKADSCEELSPRAQIEVVAEGHPSEIVETIVEVAFDGRLMTKAFVSPPLRFVFALGPGDAPPATLSVKVVARDSEMHELTGGDAHAFTPDGCNRYLVQLVDGGPVDGGPVDGGPVDGGPVDRGPVDRGPVDRGPVDRGQEDGDVDPDGGPGDATTPDAAPCTCTVGCCDESGQCQAGTTEEACGADGEWCQDCITAGRSCLNRSCAGP